jgi:hypothetical protein
MYAAIRQAKAKTGSAEELARRIKEGAIPIISDVEGFRAYYVVYAGDDTVTAISLFNNFAGAEEANRRAVAWIDQNLGGLLVGQTSVGAGPVIVHTLAGETFSLSSPAKAGDPAFQRRQCSTVKPLEYWMPRFRGA